jgi:hypothetical protein
LARKLSWAVLGYLHSDSICDFISVGNKLAFESQFMKYNLKQYCGLERLRVGHRRMIDLKRVLIMLNNGSFKGYPRFLGKAGLARNMAAWYYNRNYQKILDYVITEVADFLKIYFVFRTVLSKMIVV